ncbi:hypothetical protein [Oceanithermus sp.]|uniref:hypothetical protein n=1 Tax=Oceanithermus sp. TaxID=2268145 RepID=UPI0025810CE7|nr:hypothetical protein [Oceanithermus sp.]
MPKLAYTGTFLAIDAGDLFQDPEVKAWLDKEPRARWSAGHACCDALFTHVTCDRETGRWHIDGSDISDMDPDMPQQLRDALVQALEAAGLDEFEGIVWLRTEEE